MLRPTEATESTGVYIPALPEKRVYERKFEVPAVWNSNALSQILNGQMTERTFQLNHVMSVSICTNSESNASNRVNNRATFLANAPIFGDCFIIKKRFQANVVQLLNFTLSDLKQLVQWIYTLRCSYIDMNIPPTSFDLDADDEGSDTERYDPNDELSALAKMKPEVKEGPDEGFDAMDT